MSIVRISMEIFLLCLFFRMEKNIYFWKCSPGAKPASGSRNTQSVIDLFSLKAVELNQLFSFIEWSRKYLIRYDKIRKVFILIYKQVDCKRESDSVNKKHYE